MKKIKKKKIVAKKKSVFKKPIVKKKKKISKARPFIEITREQFEYFKKRLAEI